VQIRQRLEYLIPTCCIVLFRFTLKFDQKKALFTGFNPNFWKVVAGGSVLHARVRNEMFSDGDYNSGLAKI